MMYRPPPEAESPWPANPSTKTKAPAAPHLPDRTVARSGGVVPDRLPGSGCFKPLLQDGGAAAAVRKERVMSETAELRIGNKSYTLPVVEGSEGERAIDIENLRSESGLITLEKEPRVILWKSSPVRRRIGPWFSSP